MNIFNIHICTSVYIYDNFQINLNIYDILLMISYLSLQMLTKP